MIIQALLIVVSIFILFYFLTNRNTMQVRAYKKIALLLCVALMIVFVLYPEYLNTIANKVGVGRGADLLLYVFFVAFIIFSINVYLKFKELRDEIFRLSRTIALIEAKNDKKNK